MAYTVQIKTLLSVAGADLASIADRTYTNLTESWKRKEVLNNEAAILWDTSASANLADFDVLILYTDQPVEIEMTIKEGDAAEELCSFRLAKETVFVLGADDAYYNHSASDAFAGTLDVIDKIRAKEINSVAATVVLELHT